MGVTLEQHASLKKLNAPPTNSSPQHYKLTTEDQSEKGASADDGGNSESDLDVSAEQAYSKEHSKVTNFMGMRCLVRIVRN